MIDANGAAEFVRWAPCGSLQAPSADTSSPPQIGDGCMKRTVPPSDPAPNSVPAGAQHLNTLEIEQRGNALKDVKEMWRP